MFRYIYFLYLFFIMHCIIAANSIDIPLNYLITLRTFKFLNLNSNISKIPYLNFKFTKINLSPILHSAVESARLCR
jgi:hypothetical protein